MNDLLSSAGAELEAGVAFATEQRCKGFISAADVATFRRECFADRAPSRAEVEALFALDGATRPQSRAWMEFLVETVTDHVVWDARPTGIVATADAEWLLRLVDTARTPAAFAVLINIVDEAHRVPNGFLEAVRKRAAAGWHGIHNRPVQASALPARAA